MTTVEQAPASVCTDGKTLVLIDGHALAYRMHFALENTQMKNSQQVPTWAVYGFFNALFSLLQSTRPDAMAVSFDVGRETFRHEIYKEYKAHRESMPEPLVQQMDLIKQGVRSLGMPIYELKGYEADDVIGTLSKRGYEAGWCVKILTGDQDAFQLVKDKFDGIKNDEPEQDTSQSGGAVEVLIPSRIPREGLKTFNRLAVYQKLGVYPEQVIDYKGLRGDTSDNIPGIPGVGEKTAVKLLAEFPDVEALYANLEKLPKNKLLEKLVTYQAQAQMSKELATIILDVPIEINFDDCHLEIPDWEALISFFETCGFKTFLKQAPTLLAPFRNGHQAPSPSQLPISPSIQIPITPMDSSRNQSSEHVLASIAANLQVPHQVITDVNSLSALVQRLERVKVFALDIETTGLDTITDDLVGISISVADGFTPVQKPVLNVLQLKEYPIEISALSVTEKALSDWETVYIPIRHQDENGEMLVQLDQKTVLEALRPILEHSATYKFAHNAKFELNFFEKLGITWQGPVFDTMLASYIQDPEGRHGLKNLGFQHFGYLMPEIKTLIGSGKNEIPFSKVPLQPAAAYAACDAYVTLELAQRFIRQMSDDQWALMMEIEMPFCRVLAKMERWGVSIDTTYLKAFSDQLQQDITVLEQKIFELAGGAFNVNSPKQVGDVLFERLKIQPLKKTKGKTAFSTDVKVLEQLSGQHPVVDAILEYRQLFKLKSTYVDALPLLINSKTYRLHTSFNQAVTATGRLSSSNPNLQNIPIRTELGREIRRAFVPESKENWKLLSADYSQIELRLLAHFSEDPNLLEAFKNGEDIHQATAALVFGVDKNHVSKEMRYKAKAVNFGVVYGQSAHGLSQQLKVPRAEAAEFIDRYFFKYKNVKGFIESIIAQAHQSGEVKTLCGRIRHVKEGLANPVRSIREFTERAAFNTPLQGSAADLIKVAMIRLQQALDRQQLKTRLLLQVHDEIVLEVPNDELETVTDLIRWAMELGQPLRVPLEIDISVGDSWLES